jgi:hypothetical protein
MRIFGIAAIAAALFSTPTYANWQYTKWSMTPEQVIASSAGKMHRCDATCDKQKTDTETALTYGPYRSGEFSFKAFTFFGNAAKKLEYVQLDLNDPSLAYKLLGELKSKYGEPTSQSNSQLSTIASWRGGADQVQVFILGMGGHPTYATITYRPRQSRSNKGL